jgi:AmmeMemoRadiSam system protein B
MSAALSSRLTKPRLRLLDFQPIYHRGERMWLLRDPLQISDNQIIFPQALAQMLVLCDGEHTVDEIHAELCAAVGQMIPYQAVAEALAELDRACLLENDRFETERRRLLKAYRAQPYRPPALAGLSYPAEPGELTRQLQGYGAGRPLDESAPWQARGVVSPHIDYPRGGPVYAQVWRRAAPSALEADMVLIFGTDHNGRPGSITLTRQPYATPYGVLPTDGALIDRLAEAVGPEPAFAEELNHRQEHSVELSAVWLHHYFHQAERPPCPVIPILVGSFHHFLSNGHHPAGDPTYNRFLATLRAETAGRRIVAVASVDLAHVGPAFGDVFTMTAERRARLRATDRALMDATLRGDAAEFYQQIWTARDSNRICGFAPLYLMLRYLEPTGGTLVAYDHCPADATDTSLVSICGLLLD